MYRFSSEFQRWVREQNRDGARSLTEAGNLKGEMFGTMSKPQFKFKAGETNAFLEFMVLSVLPEHVLSLGEEGPLILQAGRNLFELLSIIRAYPKSAPANACQDFHMSAKSYLTILSTLHIKYKPKDHMLIELAARMSFLGSPKLYGCWHDEALNKLLKEVAGGAHTMVHDRRLLVNFPRAYANSRAGLTTAKRRRRSDP